MKLAKFLIPAALVLTASAAFAKQPVTVSITNNFADNIQAESRFVAKDMFDTGTRNRSNHESRGHTYKFGPKNIAVMLRLPIPDGVTVNLSGCPLLAEYERYNGEFRSAYHNTGGQSNIAIAITVDSKYNVSCTHNML